MWFVAALLVFTVAYAALRCLRPAARPRPLRPGLLAVAALAIAVGSFAVWQRRRWPAHGLLLGRAARASYATYVIHPLVLTAVMTLFAWVALAPEIKFVLVAEGGFRVVGVEPGADAGQCQITGLELGQSSAASASSLAN